MPTTDLVVFELTGRESQCDDCKRPLGKGNLLRKEGRKASASIVQISAISFFSVRVMPA
ncbi:MAG: hypothetical protein M3P29_09015 [Acidobacteriota bacterium]|nr:hypothetical protein [Acidobacteriota bacterium]